MANKNYLLIGLIISCLVLAIALFTFSPDAQTIEHFKQDGKDKIGVKSFQWLDTNTWFDGYDKVLSKEPKWFLDYIDGIQKEHFDYSIENLDNGKAKICLLPKTDLKINNDIVQNSKAYLFKNNVKTREAEPSDMETESEAGLLTKMCIDVDRVNEDYVKFGENSATFEYNEENLILTDDLNNKISEMQLVTNGLIYKKDKPHKSLGVGDNQLLHEFDLQGYVSYSDIVNNFSAIDMNTNETLERNLVLKKANYYDEEVTKYIQSECYNETNSTYYNCSVENGTRTITKTNWTILTPVDLESGSDIHIGVFGDVKQDDYYDVVFDYGGIDIGLYWASVSGDFSTDLVSYYKLDGTTGDVWDIHGTNNGTNNGTTRGVTGKINNAFDFDGTDDEVRLSTLQSGLSGATAVTFSAWIKPETLTATDTIYADTYSSIGVANLIIRLEDGDLRIYTNGINGVSFTSTGDSLTTDTWYHLVLTADQDYSKVYINGSEEYSTASVSAGSWQTGDYGSIIGNRRRDSTNYLEVFDGVIDEVGIWSRALSSTEISTLYNSGDGLSYDGFDNPPIITLNSPANDTSFSYTNIEFNTTVTDDLNVENVSLYIDGSLDQTNSSGFNGTYIFNKALSTGEHNWSILAFDNESSTTQSETRIFNITVYPPEIELSYPPNNLFTDDANQDFYAYVTDDFNVVNVSLYIDGSLDQTNSSGLNDTNYSFSKTLTEGSHTWYMESYDNDSLSSTSAIRTITLDTINPVIYEAFNLTDINTKSLPKNSTWLFNASDSNVDSCYYNTSDDATQVIVTCNSTISNLQWTTEGNKTIQYCVNDSAGFETCNTDYIGVYDINDSSFDNPDPIVEGFDATFNLTVDRTNIPSISANLIMNGSVYPITTTINSQNSTYLETIVNIPFSWGSITGNNISWYWNYSLSGAGNYTSTTQNITVYELAIDDCSSYGEIVLDLTLKDEETSKEVNESLGSKIELDFKLTSEDNSSYYFNYNNTWINDSNVQVCIPNGTLNNSNFITDFTVGFDSTNRVWEFYYLDNGLLNSTKEFNSYTNYKISLQDLKTTDSTSFLFNYFDQDGLAVEDALIHVYRKYIGSGVFREVERSKADLNGDTVIHLVEEDVLYYFEISLEGEILFTSSQYTALCQSTPCTIQIEASGESAEFSNDWDLVDDGGFTVSDDLSSRTSTLSYSTDNPSTWNYTIYKFETDGNYTVVNTGSSTGTEDSITLFIPSSSGNITFFGNVRNDNRFIKSTRVDFEGNPQSRFGVTLSVLLAGIIILTLGLFSATEGAISIVWVIFGFILSGFLGLITVNLTTGISVISYLILIGGLIMWKLTRRRK